jgi:hypothetical protein
LASRNYTYAGPGGGDDDDNDDDNEIKFFNNNNNTNNNIQLSHIVPSGLFKFRINSELMNEDFRYDSLEGAVGPFKAFTHTRKQTHKMADVVHPWPEYCRSHVPSV